MKFVALETESPLAAYFGPCFDFPLYALQYQPTTDHPPPPPPPPPLLSLRSSTASPAMVDVRNAMGSKSTRPPSSPATPAAHNKSAQREP